MSKVIAHIEDPALIKALAHPIRIRILAILERGVASPKQLATEINLPVENVAYHVRVLRKFGVIRLREQTQRRGALENFYEIVARPAITNETWAELPEIVREAFDQATITQIFDTTAAAAQQGKLKHPDSLVARKVFGLDAEGFAEMNAAMVEMLHKGLAEIEERAAQRLDAARRERVARGEDPDDAHEIRGVVITMLYDAPIMGGLEGEELITRRHPGATSIRHDSSD